MCIKKLFQLFLPLFIFVVGMSGVNAATIKVSKVEKGTNKPISGSTMTLSKPKAGSAGGDIVATWTTDGTVKTITVEPGTYLLRENYPAAGYINAEDVTITIDTADQEYNLKSESDYTKAEFGAIDQDTGKFIAGVQFQLLKADGSVYEEWISTTDRHHIDRIPLATYTLKVVSVPDGYQLAKEQSVVINELCKDVKLFQVNLPKEDNPVPEKPKEEEITNVPNTSANDSMFLYGLGFIVMLCGSGLVYKHAKQN